MLEVLDEHIPEREGRSNPRVVKKRISKFPSKQPTHTKSELRTPIMS